MKIVIIVSVVIAGLLTFANEVGRFAEDLNPYNNDIGEDFDTFDKGGKK